MHQNKLRENSRPNFSNGGMSQLEDNSLGEPDDVFCPLLHYAMDMMQQWGRANRMKEIRDLVVETVQEWNKDRAARLAAALAYYTAFSLTPFLVVVIAMVGLAFGEDAVRGRVMEQIQGLVGVDAAKMIQDMIQASYQPSTGIPATILGLATLLLGALGVFLQLQDALNTIWDVVPKQTNGILQFIQQRFRSFALILGVGFLLLVSLLVSAALAAVSTYMSALLPTWDTFVQILNFVLSYGIITLLFAIMFKYLPDTRIEWRDVWVGALVTALLFNVGKALIGLYLGHSAIASTYGAAGSLVILLLWVYYSAQILLLGAEFTQVYAKHRGSRAWAIYRKASEQNKPQAAHEAPASSSQELPHLP
jgi:membrane protein